MTRNKDSNSHLKFLATIEAIIKNSDINHPLTVKEIKEYVYNHDYDFTLDYRLILNYVNSYNDFFKDDMIKYEKKGRNIYFYYTGSSLDIMEAKAIVDLVYSSDFFTEQTKGNYKKRIQDLFIPHYNPYFNKNLNLHVIKNESDIAFYHELEIITKAIYMQKKISFEYNKPFLEPNHKEKKLTTLAPIDTCFSNNEYYLLCQGNKDENSCISYRLDYICNVKIIEESHVFFNSYQIQIFNEKLKSMTYMYGEGELEVIELIFDKSIYSNIIDKFGKNINVQKYNETHNIVQVKNIINSTFYAWIIGFGGKIQIHGSDKQINKFKEFLIKNFLESNQNI